MSARPAWPLLPLTDERNRPLGWACLQRPLWDQEERERVERVRRRRRILGMTSHLTFPRCADSKETRSYLQLCEAWCHCFRSPDSYLPDESPRVLLPYSDFTDLFQITPERFGNGPREFDFIFVCRDDPWYEACKNWQLALRCFEPLCRGLGLRGLVVGHERIEGQAEYGDRLIACGELPWPTLMHHLARSRLLLVTSVVDPSPRLLAEALALSTPILVNREILGGWHYVNAFTGAFFDNERDVAAKARALLEQRTSPREWFRSHHGPHLAGARLARFLRELDPSLGRVREVRLSLRMEDET